MIFDGPGSRVPRRFRPIINVRARVRPVPSLPSRHVLCSRRFLLMTLARTSLFQATRAMEPQGRPTGAGGVVSRALWAMLATRGIPDETTPRKKGRTQCLGLSLDES